MVHFWTWDQLRLFGPLHTRLALERIHRGRPTTRAEVVAFDRLTGDQLWQNDELKYRGLTNPVTIGQHIAVGDQQGVIHVLNASGQIISRVSTKGELTSLSVVNNRLYAQSTDGIVSIYQF